MRFPKTELMSCIVMPHDHHHRYRLRSSETPSFAQRDSMVQREHRASRAQRAMAALRIVVSILLVIHGVTRVSLGIVDDFGAFLVGAGIPLGVPTAWAVTIVEVLGGALLALGRFIRWLALFFAVELIVGIVLVHAPEGWFVVGAGRNGMEYSVLLIVVLAAVAWEASGQEPDS